MLNGKIPLVACESVLTNHDYRHEHIYGSIDQFLVRTDELMADERGIACMLADAWIVPSTLSTLSNLGLDHAGISFLVHVEKLVVGEASQINAFDFVVWIHLPELPRI